MLVLITLMTSNGLRTETSLLGMMLVQEEI
jgi:hypothetical protein